MNRRRGLDVAAVAAADLTLDQPAAGAVAVNADDRQRTVLPQAHGRYVVLGPPCVTRRFSVPDRAEAFPCR
jgi:hypothetical protein